MDSGRLLHCHVGLVLLSTCIVTKMTIISHQIVKIWHDLRIWIYLMPCIVNVSNEFVMLSQIRHWWSFWQSTWHRILISETNTINSAYYSFCNIYFGHCLHFVMTTNWVAFTDKIKTHCLLLNRVQSNQKKNMTKARIAYFARPQ